MFTHHSRLDIFGYGYLHIDLTVHSDGVESMRLELTMSTKEDEDVFKNCIEEIIEEGFTLNTIRNNAQKVKSIIRIEENPEFQKGIST